MTFGGIVAGIVLAFSSLFTVEATDRLPGYGVALLWGGVLVTVASFATSIIFGGKQRNHKKELQNASQALVALERQLGAIKKTEGQG